jgi:hypothetical protein
MVPGGVALAHSLTVVRFPFEDHNAPPFPLIEECCKDIQAYLAEDPK